MLENPELKERSFSYLKEETVLRRDENDQIRFGLGTLIKLPILGSFSFQK